MKLSLQATALLLLLAFLADTRITFSPFSITFGRGWLVLGMILIALGAGIVYYQGRWNGLKRGAEIKEEVKQEINQEEIKRSL